MKIKLLLSAMFISALAAALRLEAETCFVDFCEFSETGGIAPVGPPVPVSDCEWWGATQGGDSTHPFGIFYKITRKSEVLYSVGTGYTVRGGNDGAYPSSPLVAVSNYLYGATFNDGANGVGTLFSFSIAASNYMALSFSPNTPGTATVGLAAGPDENLYGVQETGGTNGTGALFKRVWDGTEWILIPLKIFNGGSDGGSPVGNPRIQGFNYYDFVPGQPSPVKPNGGAATCTLYGVTFFGGTNGNGPGTDGYGTVYKINNDGSGFQTLRVFSSQRSTNGYGPAGGLALSGSMLYGTTSGGGNNGGGTVFQLDTAGSNFMVLHSFAAFTLDANGNITNRDGEGPEGDLIQSGDTLYGTTLGGGINGGGTVYSINTNGGNFTVLHSFTSPEYDSSTGNFTNRGGGWTRSGLLLSGHTLLGTTPMGGTNGGGTVFAIILPRPPRLHITHAGGGLTVSWRSSATNFVLQQNLDLKTTNWAGFGGVANDDGTNKSVSFMPAARNTFFRLLNTNGP